MAVSVARVHLKVAHAALPALLPTPPKCKMLPAPLLPTSCIAAILPNKPPLAKPSRADADERWDARKIKPTSTEPSASSASGLRVRCTAGHGSSHSQRKNAASPPPMSERVDAVERWDARKIKPVSVEPSASSASGVRSADGAVRSTAGHGSSHSQRKNATSPPPMSGRADAVERWDAHKKPAASPASSSPTLASGKWTSSRVSSSAERWDMHKKRCLAQSNLMLDDGKSSSTGSNDIETEEEEEILWKPRAMYAGPGFVVAAPESSMLPMPTAFLVS